MSKGKGQRNGKGQFMKGTSGNAAGRPKGSKNKTTGLREALREGQPEELTQKGVELALEGNAPLLTQMLGLLYPRPKQRPITLDLPEVKSLDDIALVRRKIFAASTDGTITQQEAEQLEGRLPSLTEAVLIERAVRDKQALAEMTARRFASAAQKDGAPREP